MTGEMSQSEVTRENYPGLFDVMDTFVSEEVSCEPRSFDQYQGPYLDCRYHGIHFKIWYDNDASGPDAYVMEYDFKGMLGDKFLSFMDPIAALDHLLFMYQNEKGKELMEILSTFNNADRLVFEKVFKRDMGKFCEWISRDRQKNLHGEPTVDEYVQPFKVNVELTDSVVFEQNEVWDRIAKEIGQIMKERGFRGSVWSEASEKEIPF